MFQKTKQFTRGKKKKKPFTVCLDKTHKAPCLPITRPGTNVYALLKVFPEQLVSLINQDKILVRKTGEVSLLPSEPWTLAHPHPQHEPLIYQSILSSDITPLFEYKNYTLTTVYVHFFLPGTYTTARIHFVLHIRNLRVHCHFCLKI